MKRHYRYALVFGLLFGALDPATALESSREVSSRSLPLPTTVSPEIQAMIAAGSAPIWNDHPQSVSDWKALVDKVAEGAVKALPALLKKMDVTVQPGEIAGVKVFTVTPNGIPEANQNRLLINVHGGGYVLNPGEAGLSEAVLMAGFGRFKVVAIDYRMPPDHPYPAAMDDAMAVYKEILKTVDPKRIAVLGDSTGGGMSLALVLRAKERGSSGSGGNCAGYSLVRSD
jgi:epsilon-lactone hydrolase